MGAVHAAQPLFAARRVSQLEFDRNPIPACACLIGADKDRLIKVGDEVASEFSSTIPALQDNVVGIDEKVRRYNCVLLGGSFPPLCDFLRRRSVAHLCSDSSSSARPIVAAPFRRHASGKHSFGE